MSIANIILVPTYSDDLNSLIDTRVGNVVLAPYLSYKADYPKPGKRVCMIHRLRIFCTAVRCTIYQISDSKWTVSIPISFLRIQVGQELFMSLAVIIEFHLHKTPYACITDGCIRCNRLLAHIQMIRFAPKRKNVWKQSLFVRKRVQKRTNNICFGICA